MGFTHLHFAAEYGHRSMAGLLLEQGADVLVPNNVRYNTLMNSHLDNTLILLTYICIGLFSCPQRMCILYVFVCVMCVSYSVVMCVVLH